MVTTSKSIAVDFVSKQSEPSKFLVLSGMGTRCHLFSVFHGNFSDRATAKEEAEKYKSSTCCPLVRKFTSVQTEAKKRLA